MKFVLIPCGQTEWHADGRLLGRVEVPLTDAGTQRCGQWVRALYPLRIEKILHSPDELATQTAELVGGPLGIPTRPAEELSEVDIGLWAGLTDAELRARFVSAHRQLCEAPLNVSPPSGENLGAAAERMRGFLSKRVRKNGKGTIGLVLRPISFALARCALQGTDPSCVWSAAQPASEPLVIECTREPAVAGGNA